MKYTAISFQMVFIRDAIRSINRNTGVSILVFLDMVFRPHFRKSPLISRKLNKFSKINNVRFSVNTIGFRIISKLSK